MSSSSAAALIKKVESIELGSPVQVTLSAPTASLGDISAGLKCVADPSPSLEGEVVENGVGTFSISVTPQVRGRHDLTVKVRGEEIEGSPFRVFISRLGQEDQTHSIGGLWKLWGMGFDNNKEQLLLITSGLPSLAPILLSDQLQGTHRCITVLKRKGKKIGRIECSEFRNPRGVTTASDGSIFVIDSGAGTTLLLKLSAEGEILNKVSGVLQDPVAIKIIDDQVYVLDSKQCLIKIFDMDCCCVGDISVTECNNPRDFAKGSDGLYVAGVGGIYVYQCAPNGVLLYQFTLKSPSLVGSFNGLCFDPRSGNIVVSDSQNGVFVFSVSGECVGHISHDDSNRPAGLMTDRDGYIYVRCYIGSATILVF